MSACAVILSLLLLAATCGCHGQLEEQHASNLVSTLQGVGEVLECFSGTAQEGLRLHKENSETLRDLSSLHSLPDVVSQLKEQITKQNGNFESMKKNFEVLQLVATLTQENQNLKAQLVSKDEKVEELTESDADLKTKLAHREEKVQELNGKLQESQRQVEQMEITVQQLNQTVQELDEKLHESQRQVEQLEITVQQLNQTLEAENETAAFAQECTQPRLQEIKPMVQEFNSNGDWGQLWRAMEAVLDSNSEVYKQLKRVGSSANWPMFWLGYRSHTELVKLLLCAGIPVDTQDRDGETMFFGAAYNGDLDLVKFLVQRGANTAAKNADGMTALQQTSNSDVVQYLQQLPH